MIMKRYYIVIMVLAAVLGSCKYDTNPPVLQMPEGIKTGVEVSYHEATISDTFQIEENVDVACYYTDDSTAVSPAEGGNWDNVGFKVNYVYGCCMVTANLTNLKAGVRYYYIYAFTSKFDAKYGGRKSSKYSEKKTFKTLENGAPIVETIKCDEYGFYYAGVSVEKISDNSDNKPTSWGVCYATHQNPTVNDSIVKSSSNNNVQLKLTLSGLMPGTKYYFRAFGVNKYGTSYGEEMTFTTVSTSVMNVVTNQATSVSANYAILNGEISGEESLVVSEKGFYISSISETPSESDKVCKSEVAGTGAYQCLASGLTSNTTYYVRAYAVCQYGKLYGNVVSFRTSDSRPVIQDK